MQRLPSSTFTVTRYNAYSGLDFLGDGEAPFVNHASNIIAVSCDKGVAYESYESTHCFISMGACGSPNDLRLERSCGCRDRASDRLGLELTMTHSLHLMAITIF